jgi:hypothetical protein
VCGVWVVVVVADEERQTEMRMEVWDSDEIHRRGCFETSWDYLGREEMKGKK